MAALDIMYSEVDEFSKLIRVFLPELSSFDMFLLLNKKNMDSGAILVHTHFIFSLLLVPYFLKKKKKFFKK